MNIGIIGSGLMGAALGTSWVHAGHSVIFSYSRDPRRLAAVAHAAGSTARAGTPAEAASADVVLIAVHWHTLTDALAQAGSLRNQIVITCMLPMTADDEQLALGFTTSGAETLAAQTGARVVAAFNTIWSDVIRARLTSADPAPSLFYVGDDPAAKMTTAQLIRDAGFDPVDGGGLDNARLLEPFGLLMGRMGFAYNPQIAYQLINR